MIRTVKCNATLELRPVRGRVVLVSYYVPADSAAFGFAVVCSHSSTEARSASSPFL